MCEGRVDGVSLDDYLSRISLVTRSQLGPVYAEMWRLDWFQMTKLSTRNICNPAVKNFAVIAVLESDEDREVRRKLREASKGTTTRSKSAKAALAFMHSARKEDLQPARLQDILDILVNGRTTVRVSVSWLQDLLNLAE